MLIPDLDVRLIPQDLWTRLEQRDSTAGLHLLAGIFTGELPSTIFTHPKLIAIFDAFRDQPEDTRKMIAASMAMVEAHTALAGVLDYDFFMDDYKAVYKLYSAGQPHGDFVLDLIVGLVAGTTDIEIAYGRRGMGAVRITHSVRAAEIAAAA